MPRSNREIQKRIAYRYEEDSIKSIAPVSYTHLMCVTATDKKGCFVLADGLGGQGKGDVASKFVVDLSLIHIY